MAIRKKNIYVDIKTILEQARESAVRAVNFSMVIAYWKIGERIVEEELHGKARAGYGEKIIKDLSVKLTKDFGKGFTISNIKYMRQFYTVFSIGHTVSGQLPPGKRQPQIGHAVSDQSKKAAKSIHHSLRDESGKNRIGHSLRDQLPAKQKKKWDALRPELSWTHYRLLLSVENQAARSYYMNEAADSNWSTRVLERQINSFYYEEQIKQKADNPTIGIILCAEKNETIARYSVLNENKRLFASKYKLYLPSEKELAKELKAEIEWYNKKKAK